MRSNVLLGIAGGGLLAFGLSLIVWFALFQVLSHHMFIIRVRSPIGIIVFATPVVLVIAGIILCTRARKR